MKNAKKRLLSLVFLLFTFMTGGCTAEPIRSETTAAAPLPKPAALETSATAEGTPPSPLPTEAPVSSAGTSATAPTASSAEAAETTGSSDPGATAVIAFAGDTTQSDVFGEATAARNLSYPFEDVAPYFRAADLAFVNLETSVSTRGESEKPEGFGFRTDPAYLAVYREAGIDLVSLANNHTRDYGNEAFADTILHLGESGIDQVGAGASLGEAARLAVYDLNGIRVGFTACNMINMNPTWYAAEDRAGLCCVDLADCADYLGRIAEYDRECDVLFVSVHWGIEYVNLMTEEQRTFARLLCDNGADVILGSHPHVLQPIERYGESVIFYSLGNFLFYKMDDEAGKTALFEIEIDRNGFIGGTIRPVFIQYCKSNLLSTADPMYTEILTLVRTISEPYGVTVGEEGEIILIP
ncbi:MAG: CapA family protein [Bacteroides sp.]|nr:CapA family protein [Eubacterium sp.]MCM1419012.1 CapA family protein [Roseburia sp.]MCM1462866.1 CapA family protein [Bacteroides sp.]